MKIVDVSEASADLDILLSAVESGDEVIIARNGQPIARLSKISPIRREPGILSQYPEWAGWHYDPSVFAPLMTDDDLREEGFSV